MKKDLVIRGVRVWFEEIVEELEGKLGYHFTNQDLLIKAFTHSSFANEQQEGSYERLEFLGDGILNFVIALHLFKRYPTRDEGFLSKARAKVVSQKALATAIDDMDIMQYLRVSHSANRAVSESPKVKGNLFESIVGAIYLESGMAAAEAFILHFLQDALKEDFSETSITDYKSKLLERFAKSGKTVQFVESPCQENRFFVTVYVGEEPMGQGLGTSKKKAEQNAAKEALDQTVRAPKPKGDTESGGEHN